MDDRIGTSAAAIQRTIDELDRIKDRDKLVWTHGLITAILNQIDAKLRFEAALRLTGEFGQLSRSELKAAREALERAKADLNAVAESDDERCRDSLERLADDMNDDTDQPEDSSGVPARKKPGPTSRSGGAAERFPN